jgi:membrane-associated phospholipid phosphatase
VVYLGVLVWILVAYGVPTGRQAIAIIIVTGLLITRIGRGWRAFGQVIVDWLPFTAVLIAYDRTRGVADAIGLPLHVSDIVTAEKAVCFGAVPTVWLQQHLYQPGRVYWYDVLVTLVYTSHFLATPILAAVLWLRDRTLWLHYISRVVLLAVAGLITYVLFPEAPPWLASDDGAIRVPVDRLSARGWEWLHLGDVSKALESAQDKGSNPVAAMPSLHVGFACLVAMFIASRLRTRWRWLLVLYPLAMGFTLVYTGEHYVLDLLAGAAYALAAHYALRAWERRRERTRPAPDSEPAEGQRTVAAR